MSKLRYFIPSLIFILIFIDWYVFQGIKTLVSGSSIKTLVEWGYWMVGPILFLFLLVGIFSTLLKRKSTPFFKIIFHAFLAVIFTKVVFLLVLFAEDLYRGSVTLFNLIHHSIQSDPFHALYIPERIKAISQLGVLMASIPLVSFVYGVTRGKYDYKVHRHVLYFTDLPEAFDGFTITQISDIHAGNLRNEKAVQRGIDLINAQNSDLFVFTGDLVNDRASEITPWFKHFEQIKAPYGQFSVLGNHDYGDYTIWNSQEEKTENLKKLSQHHAALGYRLLLDEHITIEKDEQKISIAGVENWGLSFGKRGDLRKALSGIDPNSFKILLSHDPSHWDAQVKNYPIKIHLTLSGHTHGMQFGIELPGFKWSPVKYRYPNWAGITNENGRYLNVNRGFGFIGFEGRVGIWPEITVIELRKIQRA